MNFTTSPETHEYSGSKMGTILSFLVLFGAFEGLGFCDFLLQEGAAITALAVTGF